MHVHEVKSGFACQISNLRSYDAISRAILQRWSFPLVIDSGLLQPTASETSYSYKRQNRYRYAVVQCWCRLRVMHMKLLPLKLGTATTNRVATGHTSHSEKVRNVFTCFSQPTRLIASVTVQQWLYATLLSTCYDCDSAASETIAAATSERITTGWTRLPNAAFSCYNHDSTACETCNRHTNKTVAEACYLDATLYMLTFTLQSVHHLISGH